MLDAASLPLCTSGFCTEGHIASAKVGWFFRTGQCRILLSKQKQRQDTHSLFPGHLHPRTCFFSFGTDDFKNIYLYICICILHTCLALLTLLAKRIPSSYIFHVKFHLSSKDSTLHFLKELSLCTFPRGIYQNEETGALNRIFLWKLHENRHFNQEAVFNRGQIFPFFILWVRTAILIQVFRSLKHTVAFIDISHLRLFSPVLRLL